MDMLVGTNVSIWVSIHKGVYVCMWIYMDVYGSIKW